MKPKLTDAQANQAVITRRRAPSNRAVKPEDIDAGVKADMTKEAATDYAMALRDQRVVGIEDTEIDKVVGLELGADDYVTKPYSSRELLARMKAVMRRNSGEGAGLEEGALLTAGSVRMDIDKHQVTVNSVAVTFPLKEFELLEFLMRNSGRVLTRSQLIDRVWGNDYFGDTKTLDVHIKRLRAKIEEDPANPKMIHTIRGLGYKLEI
jgi:two-component system response regulator RegX3